MSSLFKKYRFSQRIMVVTLIIYALNYIMDGALYSMFALDPTAAVRNMEVWRLLTFPFVPGSYEGIVIFAITFLSVGPKLEATVKGGLFWVVLALLVCLQGTLTTLIYVDTGFVFAGMEGLSFFMITLFMFLNINKKIVFTSKQPVRSIIFGIMVGSFWLLATLVHSMVASNEILLVNGTNAAFGVVAGGLVFIQVKLLKKKHDSERQDLSQYEIPEPDQLSMALIAQNEKKKHNYSKDFEENNAYEFDGALSEDKLNEILDKITESGKESLSVDELRFLDEYSKNL